MINLIKLSKDINEYKYREFLIPNFVYIPINNYNLLVKKGDYVYKDTKILTNGEEFFLYSSVSGNVIDIKNDSNQNYLVIENDFREKLSKKQSVKRNIEKYSFTEFISLIKELGITNHQNQELYKLMNKKYDNLIVNATDFEMFIHSESIYLEKYNFEILETIDALRQILGFSRCILCVKNTDTIIAYNLINVLGTYPNIELKFIDNVYPLNDELLLKYLNLVKYNNIILTARTIYAIYFALKKNLYYGENIIAFNSNVIEKHEIITTKENILLQELLNNYEKYDNYEIVLDNILKNKIVNKEYVLSSFNHGIFINYKETIDEKNCIKCGLCNQFCPEHLKVYKILQQNRKSKKCTKCGACNFICPAFIDIKSKVGNKHEE